MYLRILEKSFKISRMLSIQQPCGEHEPGHGRCARDAVTGGALFKQILPVPTTGGQYSYTSVSGGTVIGRRNGRHVLAMSRGDQLIHIIDYWSSLEWLITSKMSITWPFPWSSHLCNLVRWGPNCDLWISIAVTHAMNYIHIYIW